MMCLAHSCLKKSLLAFGQQIGRTDCRKAALCVLAEVHGNPNLYQRMEEVDYAPRVKLISETELST